MECTMTESKTPLAQNNMDVPSAKVSSDKSSAKQPTATTAKTPHSSSSKSVNKLSKLAMFSLLVAIAAPAGHYFWQEKQSQNLVSKINTDNNNRLDTFQQQTEKQLVQQQQIIEKQLQGLATKIATDSQTRIIALEAVVAKLEQNIKQQQPSDWLIHEAEYLLRVAARAVWLEQDTRAALGLLKDADARLAQLNDPTFLPVREVIHQDIKSLSLLPTLDTDEVVLTLMAMNKAVENLPLAMDNLDKKNMDTADLVLSADINDWQTNLAKTWQKFLDDFIRVRARSGTIEPLISPKQQAQLKQNLTLKIQLALWAASQHKGDVYIKSINDIEQWINDFFDVQDLNNQHFVQSLTELKVKKVDFAYPNDLNALSALRSIISKKQTVPLTESINDKKAVNEVLPSSEQVQPTQAHTEKVNQSEVKL